MAESMVFHMGKYQAVLPDDRQYARNHMWVQRVEGSLWKFGFSSYAIRLMQDVYFLDWTVDAGDDVSRFQEIGHIETSKAESDLFTPLTGKVTQFNQQLLQDPSAINVDGYGAGWLFELETDDVSTLMTVQQYHQFLSDNWENTQRMIKGKINEADD